MVKAQTYKILHIPGFGNITSYLVKELLLVIVKILEKINGNRHSNPMPKGKGFPVNSRKIVRELIEYV